MVSTNREHPPAGPNPVELRTVLLSYRPFNLFLFFLLCLMWKERHKERQNPTWIKWDSENYGGPIRQGTVWSPHRTTDQCMKPSRKENCQIVYWCLSHFRGNYPTKGVSVKQWKIWSKLEPWKISKIRYVYPIQSNCIKYVGAKNK